MQRFIEPIVTERPVHRFSPEVRSEVIAPDASDPDDVHRDRMRAKRDTILTAGDVRAHAVDKDPLEEERMDTPGEAVRPDTDAGDSDEGAPGAPTSVRKALRDAALTTLADSRASPMEVLASEVGPGVVDYPAT